MMGSAACATPIDPPPTPTPAVDGRILADAPQADAPALWIGSNVGVAAWIGSDAVGVHIDARTFALDSDVMQPVVVLPLPPRRPTALALYAAPRRVSNTRVRALWLDADDTDTTQLYVAVLSGVGDGDLRVERGPIQASDRAVARYAALVDAAGTLWAVWSGGAASEPNLYIQAIDGDGRAQPPRQLVSAAAWFTLIHDADGTVLLFWIDGVRVRLMHLAEGVPLETRDLTSTPALDAVDRLLDMRAGVDRTHRYLFWNVERFSDGIVMSETWWTTGARAGDWTTPARLSVTLNGESIAARRVAPVASSLITDTLAVVMDTNAGLVTGTFRAGMPLDVRPLNATPTLIGALNALYSDDALFVAWADAINTTVARLTLVRTDDP
ncbi:MAG: hypothetical protein SGI73_03540 [Chloroflexota bacterium]|nr:hypothetical protein [Chloroflexota bacterium]